MKIIKILPIFLISTYLYGQSAQRFPHESYKEAVERVLGKKDHNKRKSKKSQADAEDSATSFHLINSDKVPSLKNPDKLQEYFTAVRDTRFIKKNSDKIKRRSSWLYPDNGCWIRAEFAKMHLKKLHNISSAKVFIFGNLSVETPMHPSRYVSWWYHVAPIVKSKGEIYVIDPAIESRHPLLLKEWVLKQTSNVQNIKLAICHPNTFGPGDKCSDSPVTNFSYLENKQKQFLSDEKLRLQRLGLDLDKFLYQDFPDLRGL